MDSIWHEVCRERDKRPQALPAKGIRNKDNGEAVKKLNIMKQFVLIVLAAMVSLGSAEACLNKAKVKSLEVKGERLEAKGELTILVMDTTQALLPEAEIRFGKSVLRTSWDGRAVVKSEDLAKTKTITVSCEGYEARSERVKELTNERMKELTNEGMNGLTNERVLIIRLTPKKGAEREENGGRLPGSGKGTSKGTLLYRTMDTKPMAEPAMVTTDLAAEASRADFKAELEETPELFVGGPTRNISAGMLTAGEVNDFAKWNLWPMVRDSILGEFIDEWKIAPRERYTVQVVTQKGGYPIASQDVSLIDGNGNTLFQAVTDNTGKAELWGELIKNEKLKIKNDLRIRVGDYVAEAKSWQTVVLDEPCDVSDAVDVMFVFDATGSMGDELRYLQAEMRDVIARAKEATGGLEIRTGAVVYRDHHYDEYLTRISRLTDDISVTQQFIDKQEANGGGDYPEAVPEALMAALNSGGFNSNARARIVFLVLDAPCHQDSATIALLHEQILNAAAMGVRIVPVVCSGLGKSGEYLMRSIALTTNGTSFFLTDDSGIGHTHLKPATDSLKVEHLNDMLVRTIVEFSYMPNCEGHWTEETDENENDQFVPNPFEISDLELMEIDVTDSPTTLYLVDISGKLITVYEGRLEEAGDAQLAHLPLPQLSTGVYFVKAFHNGQWHTKKILVH